MPILLDRGRHARKKDRQNSHVTRSFRRNGPLVAEFNKTPEEAERLVKKHIDVVTQGIYHGPMALGAAAMAIEMKEGETIPGGANGTFTLTGNGKTSPPLPHDASQEDIRSAINKL